MELKPCGHDFNSDERCEGCADIPRALRERELDAHEEEVRRAWARRWGLE